MTELTIPAAGGPRSRRERVARLEIRPAEGEADAVHAATVLARERPETPATEVFPEKDLDLLRALLESQGHRNFTRLPDGKPPDIRAAVIDIGRLVGFHPSPRQPLPGTKKVSQGLKRLHWAIQVRDAVAERKRE